MQVRMRLVAAILCLGLFGPSEIARAEILYALQNAFGGQLATVNPLTGEVLTSSAITNREILLGLTDDNLHDLYSVDGFNDSTEDRLFRIDRNTAAGTIVGDTGFNWNFRGLEFNSTNGILYAVTDSPNQLYTLDRFTGAATLVASITGPSLAQAIALAIDSQGNVIMVDNVRHLYALNLATGEATLHGAISGLGSYIDLAFNQADVLYAVNAGSGDVDIIDIPALTASPAFAGDFKSITFVPEPSTFVLSAFAGLAFMVAQGRFARTGRSRSKSAAHFGRS